MYEYTIENQTLRECAVFFAKELGYNLTYNCFRNLGLSHVDAFKITIFIETGVLSCDIYKSIYSKNNSAKDIVNILSVIKIATRHRY